MELYCPKCKQKQEVKGAVGESGICSECGQLILGTREMTFLDAKTIEYHAFNSLREELGAILKKYDKIAHDLSEHLKE